MRNIIKNQKGAIIVIFALSLIVLIGFAALGTEVGRWYLTRAELSKAVDAAALAGAANISNPTIDVADPGARLRHGELSGRLSGNTWNRGRVGGLHGNCSGGRETDRDGHNKLACHVGPISLVLTRLPPRQPGSHRRTMLKS